MAFRKAKHIYFYNTSKSKYCVGKSGPDHGGVVVGFVANWPMLRTSAPPSAVRNHAISYFAFLPNQHERDVLVYHAITSIRRELFRSFGGPLKGDA